MGCIIIRNGASTRRRAAVWLCWIKPIGGKTGFKIFGTDRNQQAEILACTYALEQLRRCCRIEIVSDSKYVIDTMMGRNHMGADRPLWSRLVTACYGHHAPGGG
ncbi:MAG: hypothetical protein IPQ00_07405 [Chloracidobacterium sp.]|nr:hypothetical protein [Chloracidobacterium sp.]